LATDELILNPKTKQKQKGVGDLARKHEKS
jgi:hypothetical protein